MGLPRLWSPFAVLLLVNTALAIVLTNTEFNLQIGTPFTITWAEASGTVAIDLYGGDNADTLFILQSIAANQAGTSFTWTPPADVPQRNAYAIVVTDGSAAQAISFAFTFAAASPTTTSTTAPPTTSTTQAPQTTSSSSSVLTTSSSKTAPSNTTLPSVTKTIPTSAPTGPPTSAADIITGVPGPTRGSTDDVLSLPAKIGVGLAAAVGLAAILAWSAFMVIRKNKELEREKELELEGGGGSTPDIGGWKTAEKRPEGMQAGSAIEMEQQPPRRSLTGSGPGAGGAFNGSGGPTLNGSGGGTPSGRLTPGGRPLTPNMPRTPSPLAREMGAGEPPAR